MHWMSWFRRGDRNRPEQTETRASERTESATAIEPQRLVEHRARRAFARFDDAERHLTALPGDDIAASG